MGGSANCANCAHCDPVSQLPMGSDCWGCSSRADRIGPDRGAVRFPWVPHARTRVRQMGQVRPPPPCPRRRPRAAGRSGTAGTATRAQSLPEPAPVCQPNGQRGQSAHRCHLEPRPLFASAVQSRFWALFPWQRLMAKLLKNEKVRRVLYLSAIYSPHPAPNFRLHSPHAPTPPFPSTLPPHPSAKHTRWQRDKKVYLQ